MPPLIRDAGMWNWQDGLEPTKALVPDRSYSGLYQRIVEDCQKNGQFDHSTMGSVSNVGLMAQKAEEVGVIYFTSSHIISHPFFITHISLTSHPSNNKKKKNNNIVRVARQDV